MKSQGFTLKMLIHLDLSTLYIHSSKWLRYNVLLFVLSSSDHFTAKSDLGSGAGNIKKRRN